MEEERRAGKLKRGGGAAGPGRGKKGKKATLPKNVGLAAQGIDKNLADHARKEVAKPKDRFEADVAKLVRGGYPFDHDETRDHRNR
jgi:hypothetical protein